MASYSDYINRGDAVLAVYERIKQIGMDFNADVLSIRQSIREVPAADVAEVRHGKWEEYLKEGLRWKCSLCGSRFTTPFHYCPSCGAKMER